MKGFASYFFFFMTVLLFASLVSLEESNEFQNRVEETLLRSHLVEQRHYDALQYFNASFRDAVIDSAHQARCNGVEGGDFCKTLEANLLEYAYNASQAIYYNNVNASLEDLNLACNPVFMVNPPYDSAFNVTRSAILNVSSGNVSRLVFVEFSTRLYLNTSDQNPGGQQNFWVLYDEKGNWEYKHYPGFC